ncbi:aminotransferase class IV family protein [Donghicola mangrovi]|uniref:Probable branched-chain-amino-acid aminotransferase n=1 Tax=Donghicola mangrovi TaxID=2729614 RepID=A0A850Q5B6_9RHOB|nr:aminotransferase class IV family protein [Donghicola mangrovi]NVO24144.1 4-amino-4-deoxychorismate lyase [Donghicola mangrovi]
MESPLRPPADPGFRLIETMLWTPEGGFQRGSTHLKRLAHAAGRLGITPVGVEGVLSTFTANGPARVRLTVDAKGQAEITSGPYTPFPEGTVWRLAIADTRLDAANPWLGVKTTQRQLYDTDRAALPADVDELIYLNTGGNVCEGTITNIFADLGQGLITPPISDGLLPGVLRSTMICAGEARIGHLTLDDLKSAAALYVGNSLRGLIRVRLV